MNEANEMNGHYELIHLSYAVTEGKLHPLKLHKLHVTLR